MQFRTRGLAARLMILQLIGTPPGPHDLASQATIACFPESAAAPEDKASSNLPLDSRVIRYPGIGTQDSERFGSRDLSSIERHECDLVLFEFALQLGKVRKRSAQSVYFIDHHTIDTSCFNVGHQTLERRALHGAAIKSNIVVVIWNADPTFVPLALDINLRRFPLGIERVGLPF